MLNYKNKVSKSSWKYLQTNKEEMKYFLRDFYLEKKLRGKTVLPTKNKSITLNHLNYNNVYIIYQGKFWVRKKFSIYTIGRNFGQFIKTRKPFYFRSKKKKK